MRNKLDWLDKIDFDVIILCVLFWGGLLVMVMPDQSDLTLEIVKDALLAYFGYTVKRQI